MTDDLDWSSLDPSRDEGRWAQRVAAIAARAAETRRQQLSLSWQLARLGKPALGIAAAVALFSWLGDSAYQALVAEPTVHHPGVTLMQWASADSVPAVPEVLASLGGE